MLDLGINLSIIISVPRTLNKLKIEEDRLKKFEVMLETANLDNEQKVFINSFIASEKRVDIKSYAWSLGKGILILATKEIKKLQLLYQEKC